MCTGARLKSGDPIAWSAAIMATNQTKAATRGTVNRSFKYNSQVYCK